MLMSRLKHILIMIFLSTGQVQAQSWLSERICGIEISTLEARSVRTLRTAGMIASNDGNPGHLDICALYRSVPAPLTLDSGRAFAAVYQKSLYLNVVIVRSGEPEFRLICDAANLVNWRHSHPGSKAHAETVINECLGKFDEQ